MGSLFYPSVIMVLFVIAFQTEGHQMTWQAVRKPYRLYPTHLPPFLLAGDHPEEVQNESSPQEPQSAVEEPVNEELPKPTQGPGFPQSEQMFQTPVKPLQWKYPEMPKKPEVPVAETLPKEPVPVDPVAVRCGEADVQVEVDRDFFGTGQLIESADMSLGDCAATGEDPSAQVLVFESELHRCGSKLQVLYGVLPNHSWCWLVLCGFWVYFEPTVLCFPPQVTEDELVYAFTLMYTPTVIPGTSIMRTNDAAVEIKCHYQR